MVGTGLVGGIKHVHHGHTKVHPQGVDHKEGEAGEQRQAVARGAACWSCTGRNVGEVMIIMIIITIIINNYNHCKSFSFPLGKIKILTSNFCTKINSMLM